MAKIVDEQNKNDPTYQKMSDNFENSLAFSAACDLIFQGRVQPSGYTEPLLHQKRLEKSLWLVPVTGTLFLKAENKYHRLIAQSLHLQVILELI